MYIRMYDELKRSEGDSPTIGIVLCSDTDDDIARYSVMHGNEQLFASKYKLYLPTKEEVKAEIETQKAMFYLQQQDNEEKETEQNLCRRSAQFNRFLILDLATNVHMKPLVQVFKNMEQSQLAHTVVSNQFGQCGNTTELCRKSCTAGQGGVGGGHNLSIYMSRAELEEISEAMELQTITRE